MSEDLTMERKRDWVDMARIHIDGIRSEGNVAAEWYVTLFREREFEVLTHDNQRTADLIAETFPSNDEDTRAAFDLYVGMFSQQAGYRENYPALAMKRMACLYLQQLAVDEDCKPIDALSKYVNVESNP